MKVRLTQTGEVCWKCGEALFLVEPTLNGWRYHCQTCQHLTMTVDQLRDLLSMKSTEQIGFVFCAKQQIPVSVEGVADVQ